MKKTTKSFLAMAILTSALSAEPLLSNQSFNDDFKRMNQYINSMMKSHFNTDYFDNLNFPKVNMSEANESYILKFDLAGISKDEIKLSINQNNVLTVEGERKSESEQKDKSFVKQEIYYGQFKRSVQLPENANQDKLDTDYNNGILTVTIGKTAVVEPKSKIIKIK